MLWNPHRRLCAGASALAVALTTAFYLLALGLAATLIAGPVLVFLLAHAANVWVFVVCEAAGFAILRSIVPQRVPFEPTGPRLTRERQPELHAFLDDVAAAVGDRPVDEVYLAPDVNAGVAEVGRAPRRRVLQLGLPLLQVLDVDALRAVIAHEHGHYAGGDTRVGVWIWRTRHTIERTIGRLQGGRGLNQGLASGFRAYGKVFLRITNAVSRRQELAADAVAARVAGADAHRRALVALERAGLVFDHYVDRDVNPALRAGVHPPIAAGFAHFLTVPHVDRGLDAALGEVMEDDAGTPYDSHPTLPARLAAIDAGPHDAVAPDADSPKAVTLLRDVAELEYSLTTGDNEVRRVSWADVGVESLLPALRESVGEVAFVLGDHVVRDAGRLARQPREVYDKLFHEGPPVSDDDHAAAALTAIDLLACATAVALASRDWRLDRLPGEPMLLTRGDDTFRPGVVLTDMRDGDAEPVVWEATCDRLGIAELSLVPPSPEPERQDPEATAERPGRGTLPAGGDPQSLAGTGR